MTSTPLSPGRRPLSRPVGHPQGGPASPHRARALRRRREGVGHAARRLPPQRPRTRRHHAHRHQRGQGDAGRRRRLHVGGLQRDHRPGYHAMLGEELVVPPPLAITDVRYVGDPVALVVAESRYLAEDACEAIEVDYEPAAAGRRLHDRRRRHREHRARRLGPRVERDGRRCRSCRSPPTSTRSFAAPRTSSSATSSRTATSPCRWRPAGIVASYAPGSRRARDRRARRSRCTRPATSSAATSRSPTATCG